MFRTKDANSGIPIKIPCGQCLGCRLDHARQWAIRCLHEKKLHNRSAFLTLTYRDADLPSDGGLSKAELQLFFKRLRKETGPGLRYFACGEYGDRTNRPHYHVLLLSHDLDDRKYWKESNGHRLYRSEKLTKIWKAGDNFIGDVTYESASYVARYITKKITGKAAGDHYAGREPEFVVMSRRPGLGAGYFEKYREELLAHDKIIINGQEAEMPRFYKERIKKALSAEPSRSLLNPAEKLEQKRRARVRKASPKSDQTIRRLRVREVVQLAKLRQKNRTF